MQEARGRGRWADHWGLRRKQEACTVTGTSPSASDLHRELNRLKQADVPWMYEVSKCAPQEALRNLDAAFAHFFPPSQTQTARPVSRQARLSPAQGQEEGAGQFSPDRCHYGVPRCHLVAAAGAAPTEGTGLSAANQPGPSGRQGALGDGQ